MGNLLDSDMAIKGYDTVAYFTTGKALKGNEAFTFKWHDMTWAFLITGKQGFICRSS